MQATQILQAIAKASEPLLQAQDDYRLFMEPLEPELKRLSSRLSEAKEQTSSALAEIFYGVTYDELRDPASAAIFYNLAWNGGRGLPNVPGTLSKLFPDSYIRFHGHAFYGENEDQAIINFSVSVPRHKKESKLFRTANLLAPVYLAALQLTDNAIVSVFDDGLSEHDSYKIFYEAGFWVLAGRHREISRNVDLIEILRLTPTYL